ncbi:MAG: hypothetical protein COC19_02845 [SAR86 cluster bacterium]|uniref:Sulfatase N-terminal domain-containing protein n=1 Tax=SAR86 cluster bacterium TaxID=2030880 RepID=A0A2A4MQ95_9GAMM|nr:MAG: hypothetical protein COC19_02845 [SAR86 cluster bacterium]
MTKGLSQPSQNRKTGNPKAILHIFALCSFAVAQPLLDLIAKNAELLVARKIEGFDIAILILVLCIGIPAALSLLVIVAGKISAKLKRAVYLGVIAALSSLLALLFLKKAFITSNFTVVVFAMVLGGIFCLAYIRTLMLRSFCDFLGFAIPMVPMLFLFNASIYRITFIPDISFVQATELASPVDSDSDINTPVVMIVFDELPILSLLDEQADIDRVRYPNFGEFAATSHWFSNAETVSGQTSFAVPAMLSGTLKPKALPIAADYPQNLFTLLAPTHELIVSEAVTSLCPTSLCSTGTVVNASERLEGLFTDLAIIYLHLLTPSQYIHRLPAISQSWGNFTQQSIRDQQNHNNNVDLSGRKSKFQEFLASIDDSVKPTLFYYHTLLPHVPWDYLPTGQSYVSAHNFLPGLDMSQELWGDNPLLVNQAYQRHLLQVGYVDTLLGQLIDKLKSQEIFDKALIIIASDHGVNLWPGSKRRSILTPEQGKDIRGITLLIKQPYQEQAYTHYEEVDSLSILPSILDIINISPVPQLQAESLFKTTVPINIAATKPFLNNKTLARKIALFSSGSYDRLYNYTLSPELLDNSSSKFLITGSETLSFLFDQQAILNSVEVQSEFIPALLTGEVFGHSTSAPPIQLALFLNQKIVAITHTYNENGVLKFTALSAPSNFIDGQNTLEIFSIADISTKKLEKIRNQRGVDYRYPTVDQLTIINGQDGSTITLLPEQVSSAIDKIIIEDGYLSISGWVINQTQVSPVDYLLVDLNGQLIYLGEVNLLRRDVGQAYNNEAFSSSGFSVKLPINLFEVMDMGSVTPKIIAVTAQRASILTGLTGSLFADTISNMFGESNSNVQ